MIKGINQTSYKRYGKVILTDRQRQTYKMIAAGYSFKEIAGLQGVTLRTIHALVSKTVKANQFTSVHHTIYCLAKRNII